MITEGNGWPGIFEDAIAARWNSPPQPSSGSMAFEEPLSQTVFEKVATSVVRNLSHLAFFSESRFVGNILQNIQLAASYLSIMTLVWLLFFFSWTSLMVLDRESSTSQLTRTSPSNCRNVYIGICMYFACIICSFTNICFRGHSDTKVLNILQTLGLSLVQFQAPLFCCLAISPIILFRTCSIVTSRFGRQNYLSVSTNVYCLPHYILIVYQFLMTFGDKKPASLRTVETLIWRDLYLVARNEMKAEDMLEHVIHSIVPQEVLESFKGDKHRLHDHFKEAFDELRDQTNFFFPRA